MRRTYTLAFGTLIAIGLMSTGLARANSNPSNHQYTTKLVTLFATPKGQALGQITPATPVAIVKTQGADVEVTLNGWAPKGYATIAFRKPGQRIVDAHLDKSAPRKVIATTKDDYGDVWQHIQVTGWMHKSDLTQHVGKVWKKARKLYSHQCSQCHSLHAPSQFTANQWPSVLQVMARRAALNEQQHTLIRKYLQMHAKDMAGSHSSNDVQLRQTR